MNGVTNAVQDFMKFVQGSGIFGSACRLAVILGLIAFGSGCGKSEYEATHQAPPTEHDGVPDSSDVVEPFAHEEETPIPSEEEYAEGLEQIAERIEDPEEFSEMEAIHSEHREMMEEGAARAPAGKAEADDMDTALLEEPPYFRTDETPPSGENVCSTEELDNYLTQKVYYATDRERFVPTFKGYISPFIWSLMGVVLAGIGFYLRRRLKIRMSRILVGGTTLFLLSLIILPFIYGLCEALKKYQKDLRLEVQYGSDIANDPERENVELGICYVSIPEKREEGEVTESGIFDLREDPKKHMVLLCIDPRSEELYYQELSDHIRRSRRGDAFVFVHGFNVTFEEAAKRTAQIAFDLKFDGAPIFYSWPSKGKTERYPADSETVELTKRNLKSFLGSLRERSGANAIHLVAHSMGSRALSKAIKEYVDEAPDECPFFQEIILAAPDINAHIFRDELAPALVKAAERVTLYASSRDLALRLSHKFSDYPRAGEIGEHFKPIDGIDAIDVSDVTSGHSYIGKSQRILFDLRNILIHRRKLTDRIVEVKEKIQGLKTWILKPLGIEG